MKHIIIKELLSDIQEEGVRRHFAALFHLIFPPRIWVVVLLGSVSPCPKLQCHLLFKDGKEGFLPLCYSPLPFPVCVCNKNLHPLPFLCFPSSFKYAGKPNSPEGLTPTK